MMDTRFLRKLNSQRIFQQHMTLRHRQQQISAPHWDHLWANFPSQTYEPTAFPIVPFDNDTQKGCCFASPEEAFEFLMKHCMKYHQMFNTKLARMYAHLCFYYDVTVGEMKSLSTLTPRQFNRLCGSQQGEGK